MKKRANKINGMFGRCAMTILLFLSLKHLSKKD
jgi:hypothetical protein